MFDTAKVQQMTDALAKFAGDHEDIYIVPEWLTPEPFALFRRMQITIRAILIDTPQKEIFGCSTMSLQDAAKNFSDRTGIIFLSRKSQSNFQNAWNFTIGNQDLVVPTFIANADEISAIYDRLTLFGILQQYSDDNLEIYNLSYLVQRFARGVTTFLDPRSQSCKAQLFDNRVHFNLQYDFDDTAIVIQGPLVYENNYTAETFKFYRSIYPNAPIVVSTWEGEPTDNFRAECQENSVVLLENELPNPEGISHINCHLKSSFQGVKFVLENTTAEFVLKCRSDQRINKSDFLTYFKNLILTFPPKGDKLRGRILLLDGSKWLPFRACDFLSFGHVADIFKLYNIPYHLGENDALTYRMNHPQRFNNFFMHVQLCKKANHTPKERSKKFVKLNHVAKHFTEVEAYILKKFYLKYIDSIDETKILETSWKFIRDYLITIDILSVQLHWPKYQHNGAYEIDRASGLSNELGFSRWLDLYRNFNAELI